MLGNASIFEGNVGRIDEAIKLLERASQLDPLHQTLLLNLGIRYHQAGRLEDAEGIFSRLIQVNPDYLAARGFLGGVYLSQKRPKAALEEFRSEPEPIVSVTGEAMAQHDLGDTRASDAALEELKTTYGDDAAFQIARVHAYRGETDAAFEWLDRALESQDWAMVGVKASQTLEPLRSDPRWELLIARMGFPD